MKPYASYNPPPKYTTPNDSPEAQELERRWRACSEEARLFAANFIGRFPFGTLPHVIAEAWDHDRMATELEAFEDKP